MVLLDEWPGFNSTDRLFRAVQKALRLEFLVDRAETFNDALQAAAQARQARNIFETRVGTACCGGDEDENQVSERIRREKTSQILESLAKE